MADEPSLPRLIRDNTSSTFAKTNLSRKRVRGSPPPDSSDPPIFSSDDDPSVEKYTQKRRKQRFRGPWFDQQLASDSALEDEPLDRKVPIRNKRTFSKKVDSGVFMGSDGTDFEDIEMDKGKKLSPADHVPVPSPLKSRIAINTPRDVHAQRKIEKCLEDGEEYIDLSRMALDHLENSTIRPLKSFVKTARTHSALNDTTTHVYDGFEPSLRIILSGNTLTKLPAELFNLNRLVFLSLRSNELQEIPPAIGKLKLLEDLNIAYNKLGYLPYEILDLLVRGGTLYDFQLHPNPFYLPMARLKGGENGATHFEIDLQRKRPWPLMNQPFPPPEYVVTLHGDPNMPGPINHQWHQRTPISGRPISGEKCSLAYQCRTEVRFLNTFGQCIKGPMFPSDPQWKDAEGHVQLPVADINDIPEPPEVQSRVPSLIEKALQSCIRSPEFLRLESYLECIPPSMPSLLRRAENVHYSGPTLCTICDRSFVVPRTEWIEWWEIEKVSKKDRLDAVTNAANPRVENERDTVEKLVPLIRRGCSWLCLPPVFSDDSPQPSHGEDENVENEISVATNV
ncbi:hypothetical protein SS1G_02751 [Sclerotinia sclerotiorum 1980 UF-70]|uniref:Leucine Rich Repeat domain protein n=2 Tax=Sclerotinia sclerotiorum (strain ATCC 18683 / 1980 / Ss-1) TaxID=665079 RepID=A7EBR5_SCLS1|nr:hypothetical protein SS1G_02751 [Sclerotinia sclerotiorum 1980 UF-70]APA08924.1 hypothetical protein sscle_04g036940 [Sclerotinia sclerotiorum 1980 UF-70]EDN99893.1 hypothetical protein SS1G_02751 [Sclerotinia sclerotiorum 1980 UF-70]